MKNLIKKQLDTILVNKDTDKYIPELLLKKQGFCDSRFHDFDDCPYINQRNNCKYCKHYHNE